MFYETKSGDVPGEHFLDGCPSKVEATFAAILEAVREAPPPAFSGGGKWEAMHGDMSGHYEARATGPGRIHYRLFCVLDNGSPGELEARGLDRPQIAVITGLSKRNATVFSDREYAKVRAMSADYRSSLPRRIAGP